MLKAQLAEAVAHMRTVNYFIKTMHLDMNGHHRYALAGGSMASDAVKKFKAWLAVVK